MAKSRLEKNKKLYETLDEEMKNSKENTYEEKLKSIDPKLNNNEEEVNDFYKNHFNVPFVIQEFIEASKSISIRVIVINEQIVGAIKRINEEDFRSNIGENRSEIFVLDEKCFAFAANIAKKLHIKYAGIDILLDEFNNPKLCEINSNAFFEEFEKTTKINVAKKFLEFVLSDIRKD